MSGAQERYWNWHSNWNWIWSWSCNWNPPADGNAAQERRPLAQDWQTEAAGRNDGQEGHSSGSVTRPFIDPAVRGGGDNPKRCRHPNRALWLGPGQHTGRPP